MKALGQYVAALLVVTVVMPGIVGFGQCCVHKPSTSGVVMHYHCGHEQMQVPVPMSSSLSAKVCQCRLCPSALARRTETQAPQIVWATFIQPTLADAPLAAVPARLYFYDDPPPQDSSVRRATLCTLLI